MAYRVPRFPVSIGIWRFGNAPPAFPDLTSPAQLTPGRRANVPFVIHPAGANAPASMFVLLPRGADIRDAKAPAGPDLVEAPLGSGRFYDVAFVDDIGWGFANEHRFAQLIGVPTWPIPYPSAIPPATPATFWIGSGGSLGLPVNKVLFNVNLPFAGLLLIVAADYNSVGGVMAAVIRGALPVSATPSPVAAAFGVTSFTQIFAFALLPGYYQCAVATPLGLDIFQYQLLFVTGLYSNVADMGIVGIGAGVPALAGPAAQTYADEIYAAPFSQIASAGPFGYGLGYTSTGGDVTDIIGGVACTLSLGQLVVNAIGVYPVNIPAAVAGAWSGQNQGFK